MKWEEIANLKFLLLNAENLFLLFDQPIPPHYEQLDESNWQRLSTSIFDNKALLKCQQLAKVVRENNPDILLLCEVGGLESLKNFSKLFLGDEYSPVLVEGNSDRNIDVGFLIRKGLPFYFDLTTNRNRLLNFLYPHEKQSLQAGLTLKHTSHKFSRDCVELRLFKKSSEKPFLICMLTHLKSPLDPERIDPGGRERRRAELESVVEIYNELRQKHPSVPILLAGDFNGLAGKNLTEDEFKALHSLTDLVDVFDLAGIPNEERMTYFQIRNGGKNEGRQIDYAFVSPELCKNVKASTAKVYRYKDHFGMTLGAPTTMEAKLLLPSDHYPVFFELENLAVW